LAKRFPTDKQNFGLSPGEMFAGCKAKFIAAEANHELTFKPDQSRAAAHRQKKNKMKEEQYGCFR
jgi:hypothetical protein